MLILGIESSCDDTSVALLDCSKKGHTVLFEKTASQIEIHKKYGGVVPEIAGRMHAEKIVPLIEAALAPTPSNSPSGRGRYIKPDAIAVTTGPGLITGLLVGVEAARTLSYALDIPLIRTNHIEGHVYSVEISNSQFLISNKFSNEKLSKKYPIPNIQYPALALIVSGGHTELIYTKKQGNYKKIGATKDDAAGECFDKVAKLLGLPYPGGPQISKLAKTGNTQAIKFPRPMLADENYLFSFAGLKTSALYWLRDNPPLVIASHSEAIPHNGSANNGIATSPKAPRNDISVNDFCASFEQAIVDVLVAKTIKAATQYKPKTIILSGGVSANKKLRKTLVEQVAIQCPKSEVRIPKSAYCMDNAAMIAVAGYYHALKKDFTSWQKIQADPNWELAK